MRIFFRIHVFLSLLFLIISPRVFSMDKPDIPEKYAVIQDSYTGESEYEIYYIQDAHCNLEAQKNIYNIINGLIEKAGVELITMEGAQGEIAPEDLRIFPYDETKKLVSNYFLKKGRINGVEYYAINSPDPVKVVGIENRNLYQQNYNFLLSVYNNGDQGGFIDSLRDKIDGLKKKFYSEKLNELDALESSFEEDLITMQEYFLKVIGLAQKAGCFKAEDYVQLVRCAEMIRIEKTLSLKEIEKQRAKLAAVLTAKMTKDEVSSFLQESLRFRLNKVSYKGYLNYLTDLIDEYDVSHDSFEQLYRYKRYLGLHDSVRQTEIFSELDSLRDKIFISLSDNEEQQIVRDISLQISLLAKAFDLKISFSEWDGLHDKSFLTDESLLGFLRKQHIDIFSDDQTRQKIMKHFTGVCSFYEIADRRDDVLVENMLKTMKRMNIKKAVIVAGGYHSQGIVKRLRDKGISYYSLRTKVSNDSGSNLYASIAAGKLSRLEKYFNGELDTLAVSSWLEENPLNTAVNRNVFNYMFKSLLISTLAWQLTGYDIASVKELNLPILRGVKDKLSEVLNNVDYDIEIVELSRVEDQVFVRLNVSGREVVYGLFSERDTVDLSTIDGKKIDGSNVLTEFSYLGGKIVAVTPVQYEGVLNAAAQKYITSDVPVAVVIRSMLANPRSAQIIKPVMVKGLEGKTEAGIPSVIENIMMIFEREGIIEDRESVESYVKTMIDDFLGAGRLSLVGIDNVFSFEEKSVFAANIALKAMGSSEGIMVKIDVPLKIKDGSLDFIFVNNAVPFIVLERLHELMDEHISSGIHELTKIGDEAFIVDIFTMGEESFCVSVSTDSGFPELETLDDIYSDLIGNQSVGIVVDEVIETVVSSITQTQSSIYFVKRDSEDNVVNTVGPSVSFTRGSNSSLDKAVSVLYQWSSKGLMGIKSGSFSELDESTKDLLNALLVSDVSGLDKASQLDLFRNLLNSYKYVSERDMTKTAKILSDKITEIIRGLNPKYMDVTGVLKSQETVFSKAEISIIYNAYIHYIDFNQENIDANALEPVILEKLLEEIYIEGDRVTPGSAQDKLLVALKGGKYLSKLDISVLDSLIEREAVLEIFSDVNALDKTFKKAGLSFVNTKKITVVRSRIASVVKDYKVVVEGYDGAKDIIRLRSMGISHVRGTFLENIDLMTSEPAKTSGLFPEIYYYNSEERKKDSFCFVEHVEGIMADRIRLHPEEFSEEEAAFVVFQTMQAWLRVWDIKKVSDEGLIQEGVEMSKVITPASLTGVIIPKDGSDPVILGTGTVIPSTPYNFYQYIFILRFGMELESNQFANLLADAMISVFGFERSSELITQAMIFAKEEDAQLLAHLLYVSRRIRVIQSVMHNGPAKKLVDTVYDGDAVVAYRDISSTCIKKKLPLADTLVGYHTKWAKKMPTVKEARSDLRRRKPSIITISGGTGGNALVNSIKGMEGESVVGLVTTFDSGGWQSYWQNLMFPHVGYVPGQSDKANVVVAHCDDAVQDLLNKRLPGDVDLSDMDYVIRQLIAPTLKAFPELKESPGFLIDFMNVMENIYELIDVLNKKHEENPTKYEKPNLASGSLKTLFIEGLNYFAGAYDFENGRVNKEKLVLANYLAHKILRINTGLILPISVDEGDLVARLKMPIEEEVTEHMSTEVGLSHKRRAVSEDGQSVYGEDLIGEIGKIVPDFGDKIEYLDVVKGANEEAKPEISQLADEAMKYPRAEIIIVAPGSLYTSSLANFTLKKFVEDLIFRGQRGEVVYPNGNRVVVEPAKRIFIVNPVYSPEDSGMSVSDMIKMIETTAQKTTGNPDLRFEDMFDAVVVNDPTKSDQLIQKYIRDKGIKVILPEEQDLHFLARKGIEVYSFDMCVLKKRFTREAGFTLKYEDKLGYSDEKLQLVTGLFLNSTREQREKESIRANIGSGLNDTKSKYKVYDRIRNGSVSSIEADSPFLQKGLEFLESKIANLREKIGNETVPSIEREMEKDLSAIEQVVQRIKSGDMRLFKILPEDGSKSILTEDLTNYQFATVVPGDEKNIKNGVYISQGLINAVTDYLDAAHLSGTIVGDSKRAAYLNGKAALIAGETLFTLFARMALMSNYEDVRRVEDDIRRINLSYISSDRSDYGTYLGEEMLKMVRQEVAEKEITSYGKFLSFPKGSTIPEKVYLLKGKLSEIKKMEDNVNSLVSRTKDIKQKWQAKLDLLFSSGFADEILDRENVKDALKEFDFASFEEAVLLCADDLRKISRHLNKDIKQSTVLLWLRKAIELERLVGFVQDNIETFIPSNEQEVAFYGLKKDIFRMELDVKILIRELNVLKDNFLSLQEMLSSNITVAGMQEAIRQLNLEYVYQKQPKLKSASPDIMEATSILNTMKGVELEYWFDEQINSSLGTSRASFLSNYDQLLTTVDKIMGKFPLLEEMIQKGTSLPDVQSPEHMILEAVKLVRRIAMNKNLNGYVEIFRLGQDLKHYYVNQLFDSFAALASRDDRELFTLISIGKGFLSESNDDYQKAERVVFSLQSTYPEPFGKYVVYLVESGKINNVDRFSALNKADDRLNSVIYEGSATRLKNSDILLEEVKNRLRERAYKLMVDSRKESGKIVQRMQAAATFFLNVHSILQKETQFRFWSVSPEDNNPGILIAGESDYTFHLSIDSDVYISKGLMDRVNYLVQHGKTERAVDMLSEVVMTRVGTRLLEQEIGYVQDDAEMIKSLVNQYSFYLNDSEPNFSEENEPYTPLQSEITRIVSAFIKEGTADVTQIPLFSYPSDNKEWSNSVRGELSSGELSSHDFLEMIMKHFASSSNNGAPEVMLHNATYYKPGKAFDVVKLEHKKYLKENKIPSTNRIIALTKTDPTNREKALEVCQLFLTDAAYSDFIYGLGIQALEDILYDIVRIVTGDDDPYRDLKNEYNEKGLHALSAMDAMISEQADPLLGAVKVAIAGNALDFADSGVIDKLSTQEFSFEEDMRKILRPDQPIMIDDYADLVERINRKMNQTIMYSIDNAGELATDLPLLKRLLIAGHKIVLVTRDKHTINDISYADALVFFDRPDVSSYFVDTEGESILNDGNFKIISSGSNVCGTDLRRVSREFVKEWSDADIRILKGQGNYETLHNYPIKQDMFFLLKVKNPMATQGKYSEGSVLIEHKEPNSLYETYLLGNLDYVKNFLKPGLSDVDKDKVEEFVLFYFEYLSEKIHQWSLVGEEEKISAKFEEADLILRKILGIPDLRVGVYKVIQDQLLRKTNLDSFLTNLIRIDVASVNKSNTMLEEQYIVIDFESIPEGNLAYIGEILQTINKSRQASGVDVKLVVFSNKSAKTQIIESLITRKFYVSGIEIIGADEYNGITATHDNAPSVVLSYIKKTSRGKEISPESVKLITKNDVYAKDSSSQNMFVIKLSPVDNFSAVTDFISGIISADSLIHGGKVPNLSVTDPKNDLVFDLMDIIVGRNGNISSSELSGKILGVKSSLPRKEKLREMEFKRVLDKAI